MAVEEPMGFTDSGELITGWRITGTELADIFMANEMYAASPDGQDDVRGVLEQGTPGSITISGNWE